MLAVAITKVVRLNHVTTSKKKKEKERGGRERESLSVSMANGNNIKYKQLVNSVNKHQGKTYGLIKKGVVQLLVKENP